MTASQGRGFSLWEWLIVGPLRYTDKTGRNIRFVEMTFRPAGKSTEQTRHAQAPLRHARPSNSQIRSNLSDASVSPRQLYQHRLQSIFRDTGL